jgi:predicted RNA binding protein YcfA (HicA-like mRNA interferase family)
MAKIEKALKRLSSQPADFTWNELISLMEAMGYQLKTTGGSSRKFVRSDAAFFIHEPHPRKVLKPYQMRGIIAFLRQEGDIE